MNTTEGNILVRMLLRVSSNQQLDADGDIKVQRNIVSEYIKIHDEWTLDSVKPEYYEGGVSGYKNSVDDREVLQEILVDAKNKEFQILVCYKDDRLGRREDEIPQYIKKLARYGVLVFTVKDGCITPRTHVDALVNYIRYWHAEGSSIDTSQRVKDAAKENVRLGRNQGGNAPYGYKLEYSGEYGKHQRALKKKVIDPERAEVVRYMYNLAKNSEYGYYKITTVLNADEKLRSMSPNGKVWKCGTVRDILRNPIYTGYEAYNRRTKVDGHFIRLDSSKWVLSAKCNPEIQIIDPELWEDVQELCEKRKEAINTAKERGGHAPTNTSNTLALIDVSYCGYCGRKLTNGSKYNYWTTKDGEKRSSIVGYYRCQSKHQAEPCPGKGVYRADNVEPVVFEFVSDYLDTLEDNTVVVAKLIETEKEQKKLAQQKIKDAKKALENLERDIESLEENIPKALRGESLFSVEQLSRLLERDKEKMVSLQESIQTMETDLKNNSGDYAQVNKFIDNIPSWKDAFKNGTVAEKRTIINKLIEHIDMKDGEMTIHVRVNLKEFLSRNSGYKVVQEPRI